MPPPPRHTKSVRLYHRIEPTLWNEIQKLCEKMDTNPSELIRGVMWQYVDLINNTEKELFNNSKGGNT